MKNYRFLILVLLLVFGMAANAFAINDGTRYFAYVTDYFLNQISIFNINPYTGVLSPTANPVHTKPTPFSITATSNGKFIYVANSTSNCVSGYAANAVSGALTPISGSPYAAGPSPVSVVLDPSGKFLYAANEGNGSGYAGSVSAYSVNPSTGKLTPVSGSPYPAGKNPYAVAVSPSGKFLYIVNSFDNNISGYAINPSNGKLTSIANSPFPSGGKIPTAIAVSGSFCYVANQSSNNVAAFIINATTGALSPVGGSPFTSGTAPVSLIADSSGKHLYVVNHGKGDGNDSTIAQYSINSMTGALLIVIGGTHHTGTSSHQAVFGLNEKFVYVANHGSANISAFSVHPQTGALSEISGSPFTGLQFISITTVKTSF